MLGGIRGYLGRILCQTWLKWTSESPCLRGRAPGNHMLRMIRSLQWSSPRDHLPSLLSPPLPRRALRRISSFRDRRRSRLFPTPLPPKALPPPPPPLPTLPPRPLPPLPGHSSARAASPKPGPMLPRPPPLPLPLLLPPGAGINYVI